MHPNHAYLLHWAESARRTLDYGCGGAQVIVAGREQGLEIFGAETFYEGGDTRAAVQTLGLMGTVVREIKDGRLDFDDGFFDLVVANEVFEHVADFEAILDEIDRVLAPGGRLLALFPSKGVIREGHIGIPMVHWLPPGALRLRYATAARRIGLGYHHGGKGPRQWASDALGWLDRYTAYRPKSAALAPFRQRFHVRLVEDHYAAFRLGASDLPGPFLRLLRIPGARPMSRVLVRRLAGMVVLAAKPRERALPRSPSAHRSPVPGSAADLVIGIRGGTQP